jgi:hypothetical protein
MYNLIAALFLGFFISFASSSISLDITNLYFISILASIIFIVKYYTLLYIN